MGGENTMAASMEDRTDRQLKFLLSPPPPIRLLLGETRKVLENKLQGVRSNLYGLTGEAKLPAVLSVVEDHLDKGIKMLVFAHHKKVCHTGCSALVADCTVSAVLVLLLPVSTTCPLASRCWTRLW